MEIDEFEARMALVVGHLVKGEFRTAETYSQPIYNLGLNRNIVFLEQAGRYGRDWDFQTGLMGVFWGPYTPVAVPPEPGRCTSKRSCLS